MKRVIFFLGIFLATSAEQENDSKDLSSIPLCATLNNVHKTFANVWEVYNEFKTTGQLWTPVATGACPAKQLDCKTLSPICAVTQKNFFKTFPNQCVLEAEQKATGTEWTIVFNGICSTNPADGFAAPTPQPSNKAKNDPYGGRYQPAPLNSIALTLDDTLASADLSPSVPSYRPTPTNYDSPHAGQQTKEKNPEPPQPCSSNVAKQYNADQESKPSPAYPAAPSMPYNYDQPSSKIQPAPAGPPKNPVPPPPTYSNFKQHSAPPKAEQGQAIGVKYTNPAAVSNSNQLPKPDQPKDSSLLSNSLPSYYIPSYTVPKYHDPLQNSPNYPLPPALPPAQEKPVGNAMQPLHTRILIPDQKKPQQNPPVSSNAYDTVLSPPAFGRYSTDEKPKPSPVAPNDPKVSSAPSNDVAPSPAVPISARYTIPSYPINPKPSPQPAPTSSTPAQNSAPKQPAQSPSPLYALPSPLGSPSYYKPDQNPKPSESIPPPPPMAARYDPTYQQPQPQAYPSPYSVAVPPAIVPMDYNSVQDSKPSPASPTPSKCDQAPTQTAEGTLTPNALPSSDSQKPLPSPGYSAPSPAQPDYRQSSLQYQAQQELPPSRNYYFAQAAEPSLKYAAPQNPPSFDCQVSPQLCPREVQLPPAISVPNYASGSYSLVPENMPSYDAKSPDTSASENIVQQPQTSPNCTAKSSSYNQGYAQVERKENPPQPDTGLYIIVQELQPSPKLPAPSPLPANYGQDYAQGQPKVASIASSLDASSYSSIPEPAPSPKYPAPSPNPSDCGRKSDEVQTKNGAYSPSPDSGDYSSTQEQRSSSKYAAPPAVPANYDRISAPEQPKETAASSYAGRSGNVGSSPGSPNYDSVAAPQPPSKYSASPSVPATPDPYATQPQREPNQSTSCKDSQSPSSEAVKEPSSNPTPLNYNPSAIPSNYNPVPKPQSYPKYPLDVPKTLNYDAASSQSQSDQPSQDGPLLPVNGNYNWEQKPEPPQPYPAPYALLGSYGKISTQVEAEQSPSSSYNAVQELYPAPTYSAPSYSAPSALVDDTSGVKNLNQNSAQEPSASQQGYECPLSSVSSSPVSAEKPIGNSYSGSPPNSYVQPYTNQNPDALYSPPNTEQDSQQSSNSYLPSPEQSSPASYAPKSSGQPAPNDIPYSNTQTYNLPPQSQTSSKISVTSDDANKSDAKEPESNSNAKQPEDYADASKSSQNSQDEAPTIYNGVVYQGPYYYEPKYKHINFGNFNFLPPQSPPSPVPAPAPSTDPPAEPVNPSALIPETQYPEYNVNPFELLLKQLQYIVAKNGESSY